MMPDWEALHIRLDAYGVIGHPVSDAERRATSQAWLDRYCPEVKRRTGNRVHHGFRWHVYSYGFQAALEGRAARAAYLERQVQSFLVYFESYDLMFTCSGSPSPMFDDWGDELYVCPPKLDWTMLFTHEQRMGLGPYFALPPA